jgi:hypothetical protein
MGGLFGPGFDSRQLHKSSLGFLYLARVDTRTRLTTSLWLPGKSCMIILRFIPVAEPSNPFFFGIDRALFVFNNQNFYLSIF